MASRGRWCCSGELWQLSQAGARSWEGLATQLPPYVDVPLLVVLLLWRGGWGRVLLQQLQLLACVYTHIT